MSRLTLTCFGMQVTKPHSSAYDSGYSHKPAEDRQGSHQSSCSKSEPLSWVLVSGIAHDPFIAGIVLRSNLAAAGAAWAATTSLPALTKNASQVILNLHLHQSCASLHEVTCEKSRWNMGCGVCRQPKSAQVRLSTRLADGRARGAPRMGCPATWSRRPEACPNTTILR